MSMRIGSVSATKWQAGSHPHRRGSRMVNAKPARPPLGESPLSIHHKSVLSRRHDVADNGCFTECLAGFQPMQPFHQHVAFAIAADQDGRLLPDLKDALGD